MISPTAQLYDWAFTATIRNRATVSINGADPNALQPIRGAVTATALELTEKKKSLAHIGITVNELMLKNIVDPNVDWSRITVYYSKAAPPPLHRTHGAAC